MQLVPISPRHVDFAWRDGGSSLGESCVEECTPDQLRMLLSRGERQLVRMDGDGKTVGWGAFVVQDLPNMRVLFVTNMTAHNGHFEAFYGALQTLARDIGCSRVRFASLPPQARLFMIRLKAKPVYQILELEL